MPASRILARDTADLATSIQTIIVGWGRNATSTNIPVYMILALAAGVVLLGGNVIRLVATKRR